MKCNENCAGEKSRVIPISMAFKAFFKKNPFLYIKKCKKAQKMAVNFLFFVKVLQAFLC